VVARSGPSSTTCSCPEHSVRAAAR
jgi:hypothetical protein